MQSECDGMHDGSPYKQVNPMQHYENTASERGSRVDGFNPEYGSPTIPTVETLREVMDEKDLWPINKEVWDYHDGGGFHLMSTIVHGPYQPLWPFLFHRRVCHQRSGGRCDELKIDLGSLEL